MPVINTADPDEIADTTPTTGYSVDSAEVYELCSPVDSSALKPSKPNRPSSDSDYSPQKEKKKKKKKKIKEKEKCQP